MADIFLQYRLLDWQLYQYDSLQFKWDWHEHWYDVLGQATDDEPSGSEGEYDSDEDAYDLREVSSDVEMHPDDLDELESDTR